MFERIMQHVRGIKLPIQAINYLKETCCEACAVGKLFNKGKKRMDPYINQEFLTTIYGDICGPISPSSGPFYYYICFRDGSGKFSHVDLLTSRNMFLPKLLGVIIRLRNQFPDNVIKSIRLDNAGEFTSKTFTQFCDASGIDFEPSVPYAHNSIAENFIRLIQMIARPILLQSNLPLSCWGHAVLHAGDLIKLRPSLKMDMSPLESTLGVVPDESHIRIFGCAVYVPVPTPAIVSKMGVQRKLGIYMGFKSRSIFKYLDPTTGDLFSAHGSMCIFDEHTFPSLGGGNEGMERTERSRFDFNWPENLPPHVDHYNGHGDKEIKRMLYLQHIARNSPDTFVENARITASKTNAATNAPASVQIDPTPANHPPVTRYRGRPKGVKNRSSRKRRTKQEMEREREHKDPTMKD